MTLQDLMHFEEKLLLCDYKNKFIMTFNDYIMLDEFLTKVENITNLYFQLMDDFKKDVVKENITNQEKNDKIIEFSNKLLNENIIFDFSPYKEFMEKYNIN